jgi:hypothetical protein
MSTIVSAITPGVVARPKRGRWLRRLMWSLIALLAFSVFALFSVLGELSPLPLEITVNGTSVAGRLDLAALLAAHKLAWAVALAVMVLAAWLLALLAGAMVAVVLVPLLLLLAGVPMLVVGVVLLALFWPFLLLAWCLRHALKPSRPATMGP